MINIKSKNDNSKNWETIFADDYSTYSDISISDSYETDNIDKKDDNNDNKERYIFENREKLENIHINNDNDKKIKKS